MKHLGLKITAGLLCLFLVLSAGGFVAAPAVELTLPKRSYQEYQPPEELLEHVSFYAGCTDYEAVSGLQSHLVQEINRQFGENLSRKATLEDVQAGEYYRIYITDENLYRLHTTQQLLETLEQGEVGWDCYITVENYPILVKLRLLSVTQDGQPVTQPRYWTIQSMEAVQDDQDRAGYDAAVQVGLQYDPDAAQVFLVRNPELYGFNVCLLCSDTIDTLVTVGETSLYGSASFLQQVLEPQSTLEEGVFSFPQLAARCTSFQPTSAFLPVGLALRSQQWGYSQPNIIQRQGLTPLQGILLTASLLGAVAGGVFLYRKRQKRKQVQNRAPEGENQS